MKRSLVLLAFAGAASVALAQTPPVHARAGGWGGSSMRMMPMAQVRMRIRHMERWRMHQLTVLLGLSPTQQQQVRTILRQQRGVMRRNMKHFRQTMRRAMVQMRTAQRATHRETVAKLSHVLSAEQMAKFKVLMPPHGMFRFRHFGPGGPLHRRGLPPTR